MTYATPDDLERDIGADALTALSDRTGSGARDEAVIARALDDASAVIDGYLGGRYALPLATPPALLNTWCRVIAHQGLHVNGAGEHVRTAYEDVMSQLKDVARGTLTLTLPGIGTEPAPAAGGGVRGSSAPRQFDRTTLADYTR